MLYSAFHMLGMNVNNLGNAKCFNLCLKLCSIYIYTWGAKCDVWIHRNYHDYFESMGQQTG